MYGYVNVYSDILMVYMVYMVVLVWWYGMVALYILYPALVYLQYSTVHGGILIDRLYKTIRLYFAFCEFGIIGLDTGIYEYW